ncbi:hypothetical protein L3Q82_014273 [Scortum barcoo]|uniref:Uncharacterized protein n=1 Tax=Scortum barcoo TaxID=214431 RepID=A0ACB8VW31_9TELE|nr:hypothetical protein L3Q82_014273 [Scortum barcoo]
MGGRGGVGSSLAESGTVEVGGWWETGEATSKQATKGQHGEAHSSLQRMSGCSRRWSPASVVKGNTGSNRAGCITPQTSGLYTPPLLKPLPGGTARHVRSGPGLQHRGKEAAERSAGARRAVVRGGSAKDNPGCPLNHLNRGRTRSNSPEKSPSAPGSMRRSLQPTQVAQVVQLIQDGTSMRAVARRFAVSVSVVSRAWRRYQETGQYIRRRGGGRRRATTQQQDRYLRLCARKEQEEHCQSPAK